MRSLVVARSAPRIAGVAEVLRREGFDVVTATPPLALSDARGFDAVFLDAGDGEDETLRTLGVLQGLTPLGDSPFVGVLGAAPGDELATAYAKGGAQTVIPLDTAEFARRMRFITNAIQMRASLSKALRELRVSEERWRVALAALDEGLLIQAKDGTVTTMNPAAARILGMTEEEVLARSWHHQDWEVRAVDGHRLRPEEFPGAIALATGRPCVGQLQWVTNRRGHAAWISASSHPILDLQADEGTRVVTTLREVTEQRRLEMQLMAAERLSSLGRLAASVGHELNNPLTYVLGGIDSVARRLRARGEHDDADMLDEAMEGAQRIRAIVRDLRVFTTPRADALTAVDVRRVIESCARMAAAEVRPRARLVLELGPTGLARANEARLAQVLLNLLVNAAQAIPEGRPLENSVTVLTRTEADGRVAIVVRDTGVGISPDNLPLVFEPFFTTKADKGGSGLGLSICKMLVAAQGGELRIASAGERGTEATVLLAPATAAERERSPRPPAARPSAAHRVLVVDDEPQIARLIAECLTGCVVTVATSGREAIDVLEGDRAFDAVVCDLMMPDTNGADVHAFIQRARPSLEPHMLFITGGAYTPRAVAFVASVEKRCLDKPFTPDAIVEGVERAVRGFA